MKSEMRDDFYDESSPARLRRKKFHENWTINGAIVLRIFELLSSRHFNASHEQTLKSQNFLLSTQLVKFEA
jgi:hypothetical protein